MPSILRTSLFWKWTYAAWFVILWTLSSLSHPGPKINISGIDKVEHAFAFFCGGLALGLALCLGKTKLKTACLLVVLVGGAVGFVDEYHQTFTPGRSGLDVYDWLADVTGSLLAAISLPMAFRVLKK